MRGGRRRPAEGEVPAAPLAGTRRRGRRPRWKTVVSLGVVFSALVVVAMSCAGCSPVYVARAGWAELKILRARQSIPALIADPATDSLTRVKLAMALEAREFGRATLGLDVGDSYTTFSRVESDTLAMILSAAYRDRLASRTWWFPVVGHVPYRGYFDLDDALEEQRGLEREGFDTYLRPTAAFSTLGWFSDPLLSTLLRYDEISLFETVLHELSHNHLFVPGRVQFNESFATWVGHTGAIQYFCTPPKGVPGSEGCGRAEALWRDAMRFSRFLDGLVADVEAIYADSTLTREERVAAREPVFERHRTRFVEEVQPAFEVASYAGFAQTPLNNATLLSRMRYYHRLPDFQAFLDGHGGNLAAAIAELKTRAERVEDPFEILPGSE